MRKLLQVGTEVVVVKLSWSTGYKIGDKGKVKVEQQSVGVGAVVVFEDGRERYLFREEFEVVE